MTHPTPSQYFRAQLIAEQTGHPQAIVELDKDDGGHGRRITIMDNDDTVYDEFIAFDGVVLDVVHADGSTD